MNNNKNKFTWLSPISILKKFTWRIYLAIKWLIRSLFTFAFSLLKEFIFAKPAVAYKMFSNFIWFIVGSGFLFSLNIFGLQDIGKNIIDIARDILKNFGVLNIFKSFNIKVLETYYRIFGSDELSETLREKAAEKIKESKEDETFLSRKDYKDAVAEVKSEQEYKYKKYILVILSMVLFQLILYFFGSDILTFLYGSLWPRGDDGNQPPQSGGEDINISDNRSNRALEKSKEIVRNYDFSKSVLFDNNNSPLNPENPFPSLSSCKQQDDKLLPQQGSSKDLLGLDGLSKSPEFNPHQLPNQTENTDDNASSSSESGSTESGSSTTVKNPQLSTVVKRNRKEFDHYFPEKEE